MIMKNSMRHTTRLLLLSLLVLSLAGCHQSVVPSAEEQQADGCERPVRITARILPSDAPLRANDGEVKDDPDDDPDTPFDPEVVDPNNQLKESRIDHVMLYVYDKDKLIRTIFYNNPSITKGMPTAFDGLEVKPFGTETGGIFTFDLLLSPGRYRFVMLVNDPQCYYEAMRGTIRDPQKIYLDRMTDETGILSSQNLGDNKYVAIGKYVNGVQPRIIPMTGQAMLTIPKGADDGTVTTVTPSIDLERVFARVEFILTTATKDQSEFLSPDIPNYRVDNRNYDDGSTTGRLTKGRLVDLVDKDWRAGTLEMLPYRGEYTATGRDMPEDSRLYSDRTATDYQQYFRDAATYRAQVTTPYAQNLDDTNYFLEAATSSFPKMYHRRSQTSVGKKKLNFYYLYIPPMCIDGLTKEDMPYILIGINTTGEEIPADAPVAADQMTYFRLPITTLVSAAGGGIEEKFEVRRNTTYSIYAAFRGGRLILDDGIKVYPWRRVDQEIPIDPDADGETLPDWNK